MQYMNRREVKILRTKLFFPLLAVILLLSVLLSGCANFDGAGDTDQEPFSNTSQHISFELENVPEYSGSAFVEMNQNEPYFTEQDISTGKTSFEKYSKLDSLGRCGPAYASIDKNLMPVEARRSIGGIKPSGWHLVKYNFVDGKYLYNRCHLIAYQLAGENANPQNLITGTRYLNTEGMLPFENRVASYVKKTNNHVLYRVTPVFEGKNLLASGVLMEGFSVEDQGKGIKFCVYCYNVHPGVVIDYADGASRLAEEKDEAPMSSEPITTGYVLNVKTMKFHRAACSGVKDMKETNKRFFSGSREEALGMGYKPCKICNP